MLLCLKASMPAYAGSESYIHTGKKTFFVGFPRRNSFNFHELRSKCAHATEAIGVRLGSIHTQIVVSACNTWQLYIYIYIRV